ncbi:hypothetical protein DXG03_000600 [Asterophora parasitica]|uniref:Uncharacterized protein n=1 Tax=Asterophora parasitica TaxID=117018 RepID=A0A9P7G3U7_9AGAR|nr:hypothetical protein DXG03_000600 [Asterophora parasitica]
MATSRTLEPFSRSSKARSLLQTRSLRDLQAPPPPPKPPIPEKSRRRVLQVNQPFVVREVCPPLPQPSRAELLHTPSYVRSLINGTHARSQTPPSMQVSPFVAATSASFGDSRARRSISPYKQNRHYKTQSSPDASADTRTRRPFREPSVPAEDASPHPRRDPPVDPRKARRYGTDFGLGRDGLPLSIVVRSSPSPPPVPDNSSLASTPMALYTEAETDSDTSSVDHVLDLSFPQPPPIDESDSLRLRRMHSSPMFSSQETDAVKQFLRKRWGAVQASASKGSPTPYDQWAASFSKDSSLDLSFNGDLDLSSSSQGRFREDPPLTSPLVRDRKLSTPTTFPASSRRGNDVSWKRATTTPTPIRDRDLGFGSETASTSSGPRKETNAPAPKSALKTPVSKPNQQSTRLPPEVVEPLGRLDISMEKLKAHDPHADRAAAVPWEYQSTLSKPLIPISPPSLASAGRQKPSHRSHSSVPLTGLGLSNVNDTRPKPPRSLGTPFNHCSTFRVVSKSSRQEPPIPKSFIDITPEREIQRGSSKKRMRKLLARASVGVIGWGKGLGRKKSTLKLN